MREKVYTQNILATLVEVANQYVDEPDLRKSIVSKCYQGIGMLITGAPGKPTIDMDNRESMALKTALSRRKKKNLKNRRRTLKWNGSGIHELGKPQESLLAKREMTVTLTL